ncbi:MAG: serine hydroxymethyltransferase [Planctomycetota bacterium]|jgi:glycine hydroxymethyltransferase|nr:serine hydroxymethyltransferase [Planctomycetota bacterium]
MSHPYPLIDSYDPETAAAMLAELERQETQVELIASENHTSPNVLEALGSVLTNKYAEGYPGRRYYGGCEHVDVVENLACERLCNLFKADHANVQPSSGSQANQAAMLALIEPGDTVLAMELNHGGHLSHGHPKNVSGMVYDFHSYGVDSESERIDYDQIASMVAELKPKLLLAGASAYPREIDFSRLSNIAKEFGASLMVDMAHIAGLVAAGLHPSPVPFADVVTMTTHKTLRGPRGGAIICTEEWKKKIDSAVFPGMQGGPLMHVIAGKSIAFKEAGEPSFVDYQKSVLANAQALAKELASLGYRLVSGGTDNHLMLVDLRGPEGPGITGRIAEDSLHAAGITVNKNLIPFDPEKPMQTSGIRIGTPAVTTRGFTEGDMRQVANWMDQVLRSPEDLDIQARVLSEVTSLCCSRPIYPSLVSA